MPISQAPDVKVPRGRLRRAWRWSILAGLSAAAAVALEALAIPAAFMLGPLLAAVLVQRVLGAMKVPPAGMIAAQAIVGCLIARAIDTAFIETFVNYWPLLLGSVLASMATSGAIGWMMSRLTIIPGTASVWGMLPGGATVMMIMAEAYGSDIRIVAFMQYVRVVMVAAVAAGLAFWLGNGAVAQWQGGLLVTHSCPDLAITAAIIVGGGFIGAVSRIPAGPVLIPMGVGAFLHLKGLVTIEIPPLVLLSSYAVIGWTTGLRFTKEVMAVALRTLPSCVLATSILMAVCALLAWMLVLILDVDPVTAYLATTPGGLDTAAVLASSIAVDVPFVMAFQTARVVILVLAGPYIARWLAGTLGGRTDIAASGKDDDEV